VNKAYHKDENYNTSWSRLHTPLKLT